MPAKEAARVVTLVISLLLSFSAHAEWWNDDWDYRKQITLDTTAAGANLTAPVDNAPVLLRLHIGNFGYFADTNIDGSDIRLIAGDDRTPLPFYIESYDQTLEMALIWVQVPRLDPATSASVYMYYGNPEAQTASNPAAIQDVSQLAAYSFESEPFADLTEYGNNPVSTAIPAGGTVIGNGAAFNGAEVIQIPASPVLRYVPANGITISQWVRFEQPQSNAVVVESLDPAGPSLGIRVDGLVPRISASDGATPIDVVASVELQPATWHLVAASFSSDATRLYVDGQLVGEGAGLAVEVGGDFLVGLDAAGGSALNGAQIDQLSISGTVRGDDYQRLKFANQGISDLLVRFGEDGQREAGEEPSYLIITLQNVTVDGWVVIVMLAFMSIISWVIMISKGMVLRRVRKENDEFLRDFRKVQDISELDREEDEEAEALRDSPLLEGMSGDHDHYQSSTLYHLYHTGITQLNKRLMGAAVGADRTRSVSRQSMDAIRAAIDSTSVRETQKLNNQMVLLTIAIAGGPFLGLLGTVVGVMITFAAIAASGDVNVNSIAPGIAAALAATVAGLAVAIPALFGYNYLAAQIKEIVADDRVFIDEFTTRLAETYR